MVGSGRELLVAMVVVLPGVFVAELFVVLLEVVIVETPIEQASRSECEKGSLLPVEPSDTEDCDNFFLFFLQVQIENKHFTERSSDGPVQSQFSGFYLVLVTI